MCHSGKVCGVCQATEINNIDMTTRNCQVTEMANTNKPINVRQGTGTDNTVLTTSKLNGLGINVLMTLVTINILFVLGNLKLL